MFKQIYPTSVFILFAAILAACTRAPSLTPEPTEALSLSATTVLITTIPSSSVSPPVTSTEILPSKTPTREETLPNSIQNHAEFMEINQMNIKIGEYTLKATLAENSSVDALKEVLAKGPITIDMRDYANMEKVGPLGMDLPRNDTQITTQAGDIILYQGSALVIYYEPNSWNFTRLGKINDVSAEELKKILGTGNVTITLSLESE